MKNEILIKCQDCKHWKIRSPENQPTNNKWKFGVCKRLQYGVLIIVKGEYQEAVVDRLETDANFACIYAEK
jgi:hypothetical protein